MRLIPLIVKLRSMATYKSPHYNLLPRSFITSYNRIAFFITIFFFVTLIFDGMLRFYFKALNIYPAVYFPKILLLLFSALYFLKFFKKYSRLYLLFLFVVLSAILGLINLGNSSQVLFGFWVSIPFLFGCILGRFFVDDYENYLKACKYLFLIAATGVILNPLFSYPWIGANFHFFGAKLTASRFWTTYWYQRYPGFSHSAINAGSQVIAFATLAVFCKIPRIIKLLIWALAGLSIYLTTSKGIQATYILLSMYFFSLSILRSCYAIRLIWASIGLFLAFTNIAIPVASLFFRLNVHWSSIWDRFFYGSYFLRFHTTWPNTWGVFASVWQWILGKGLGAVGSAQRIYGTGIALPADNVFLFIAVTIGPLLAGVFLIYVTYRTAKAFLNKNFAAHIVYPLLLIVLSYGEVSDIIDGTASLAVIFGLVTFFAFNFHRYKLIHQYAESREVDN